MPTRPATTILLITEQEVVRADFSGKKTPQLTQHWRQPRGLDAALPTAVELAISLGPKLGREVLVLTTSAWTQTISLPAGSTSGMDETELAQTLRFEVEAFSGLNAFDSQLSFKQVNHDSQSPEFWITQVEIATFNHVEEMISLRGGKLLGLASPFGVPQPLTPTSPWQRMEYWHDLVGCIAVDAGLRVFIANSQPRSTRWQVALENWQASTPTSEWLVEAGVAVPHEYLGETTQRLEDSEPLEDWLAHWAAAAVGADYRFPIIVPTKKVASKEKRTKTSLAIAVGLLAICIGHYFFQQQSAGKLAAELEPLQDRTTQKQNLDAELRTITTATTALASEAADLATEQEELGSLTRWKGRFSALLASLARQRDDDFVINKITPSNDGLAISGTTLEIQTATRLAKALQPELLTEGWSVEAPTQEGANTLENGGPWKFTLRLKDRATPILPSP
ncbi:MAG: hypothetical protein MK165_21480 [Pirellulaceae bacterium]|nr:hypothetical protein [Pirellulaceae bacterium]